MLKPLRPQPKALNSLDILYSVGYTAHTQRVRRYAPLAALPRGHTYATLETLMSRRHTHTARHVVVDDVTYRLQHRDDAFFAMCCGAPRTHTERTLPITIPDTTHQTPPPHQAAGALRHVNEQRTHDERLIMFHMCNPSAMMSL